MNENTQNTTVTETDVTPRGIAAFAQFFGDDAPEVLPTGAELTKRPAKAGATGTRRQSEKVAARHKEWRSNDQLKVILGLIKKSEQHRARQRYCRALIRAGHLPTDSKVVETLEAEMKTTRKQRYQARACMARAMGVSIGVIADATIDTQIAYRDAASEGYGYAPGRPYRMSEKRVQAVRAAVQVDGDDDFVPAPHAARLREIVVEHGPSLLSDGDDGDDVDDDSNESN